MYLDLTAHKRNVPDLMFFFDGRTEIQRLKKHKPQQRNVPTSVNVRLGRLNLVGVTNADANFMNSGCACLADAA